MERPTFEQMVKNLFKIPAGYGSGMMHAAIGIVGESGELREAGNRKNLTEECGDLEFYMEACWQQMTTPIDRSQLIMEQKTGQDLRVATDNMNLGNIIDHIHTISADILDKAKKVWIYQSGNKDKEIAALLLKLDFNIWKLYDIAGFTRDYIRRSNQDKLLGTDTTTGRYGSGRYSDAAALARADKEEPVSQELASSNARNFIGATSTPKEG